jgi:hypothetical protein
MTPPHPTAREEHSGKTPARGELGHRFAMGGWQRDFQDEASFGANAEYGIEHTGEIWSRPASSHLADQRLHCKLARGVIVGAVDRDPSAFAGPRLRVRQRLPVIVVSGPPGE